MNDTKSLLSLDEAAKLLNLSKSYLYKLTSNRKISHYKPNGKLIYFNREELTEWLQQNRISSTDEIEAKAQAYCTKVKKGGAR